MKHSFLALLCFIIFTGTIYFGRVFGCGGGGVSEISVNNLDGASNITIFGIFKYIFSQAIDPSTVTSSTFFMVESSVVGPDVSKATLDPTKCDNTQAIGATVSCPTTTECTLDPTSDLVSHRSYFVCLSDGIKYSNGNFFEGFMATFTTLTHTPR